MNPAFKNPFTRYFAPAGDDGTDNGGAAADVAVLDDDDYMALPEAERRRLRGDGDTPEPSPGPTATTEGEGGEEDTEQEHAVATADNDEPGSDKGGNGIPRTRFNEVNKKRQALEAEVEELRAQLAARDSASAAAAASPAQSQKLSIAQAEEEYKKRTDEKL